MAGSNDNLFCGIDPAKLRQPITENHVLKVADFMSNCGLFSWILNVMKLRILATNTSPLLCRIAMLRKWREKKGNTKNWLKNLILEATETMLRKYDCEMLTRDTDSSSSELR